MADTYGSDFLSIVDDDGNEYELEVLSTVEYQGAEYLAVLPAGDSDLTQEVTVLRSVEEDGEAYLTPIEDEGELQAVYDLLMDLIFQEDGE